MDHYKLILLFCFVIILSYAFIGVSKKYRIPSVILLVLTGVVVKKLLPLAGWDPVISSSYLNNFGTIGLILIVLEGCFELRLEGESFRIVKKSFLVAGAFLLLSSFLIGGVIFFFTKIHFIYSYIYAIPLSIVSSAIVIPSVMHLPKLKKEFMIYESTFSDILGIILFNLVVVSLSSDSIISDSIIGLLATLAASVIIAIALVFAVDRIRMEVKFVFIIAILMFFYSLGKVLHLSSLLFVLSFGLLLANMGLLGPYLKHHINMKYFEQSFSDFKKITAELSFLVRSIFFVLFGFSIDLNNMLNMKIVLIGSLIVFLIYLARYINLKIFIKTKLFPEIFISPRGLVTILLYFSIPGIYYDKGFMDGILVYIIVLTSVIMTGALMVHRLPVEIEKKGRRGGR